MFEKIITTALPEIIHMIELMGIIVITFSSVRTFILYARSIFRRAPYNIKLELGHALAIGLEFKMGAEILKTVLIQNMDELYMLGAIIILRGVLAIFIRLEMKDEINVTSPVPVSIHEHFKPKNQKVNSESEEIK